MFFCKKIRGCADPSGERRDRPPHIERAVPAVEKILVDTTGKRTCTAGGVQINRGFVISVYRIIFIGRLRAWENRSIIKNARQGMIYPMH